MPLLNRVLGALRGAADPGRGGRRPLPAPGGAPGRARGAGGGLAGLVGSLLGGRGRRRI